MKKIWILSLALPMLLISACGDSDAEAPPAGNSEEIAGPPPKGEDDGTGGTNTQ